MLIQFSVVVALTGCGGIYEDQFFHSAFPGFVLNGNHTITSFEMLTVVFSLKLWCVKCTGKSGYLL